MSLALLEQWVSLALPALKELLGRLGLKELLALLAQ